MKKLCIFIISLFFGTAVFGQFETPDLKEVNAVKGKVLLIPTMEEVTRILVDLADKQDELKAYKDGVATYNQNLKEAAEVWKFGKGVEFMPVSEVKKIKDAGNGKYVILEFGLREGGAYNTMKIGPV